MYLIEAQCRLQMGSFPGQALSNLQKQGAWLHLPLQRGQNPLNLTVTQWSHKSNSTSFLDVRFKCRFSINFLSVWIIVVSLPLFQTLCQYKFDFLQEVCQHEHFIPLCLPIRSANIPGNNSQNFCLFLQREQIYLFVCFAFVCLLLFSSFFNVGFVWSCHEGLDPGNQVKRQKLVACGKEYSSVFLNFCLCFLFH